jgi:dihydropteroate synthase
MAIINCTEDSFFSGSHNAGTAAAVERALQAAADGADIIDFGGESTRPGAAYVSEAEETRRLLPVIAGFRQQAKTPVSVDTRKAPVMRRCLDAGADIANDVSALEDDPDMGPLCADHGAPIILLHTKGIPACMQERPWYADVVAEVRGYLADAVSRATAAGIPEAHIILDPGIGFGKRLEDNLALIAGLDQIRALGRPVLMGLSRKTFIGRLTGRDTADRLAGTLAANAACLAKGVEILRVHDVPETVDLITVWEGIQR